MPGVYISFARSDKVIAETIARDLRQRGAEVYWDYQEILTGEDFIGRLGQEIARRSYFVLLLSPDAVTSRWVKAEVAWALYCKREIVPVMLDAATSLTGFLFLYDAPCVDFSAWASNPTQISAALNALAGRLDLPTEKPYQPFWGADGTPPTEIIFNETHREALYEMAGSLDDKLADTAHFVYTLLGQLNPDAGDERLIRYFAEQGVKVRAQWVDKLRLRMLKSFTEGDWSSAESVAQRILEIQPNHTQAQTVMEQVALNKAWDAIYQHAARLAAEGQWVAARHLLASIKHGCPTFGDPQDLLTLQPASVPVLQQLQTLKTEYKHQVVTALAFSPDSREIAAAYTGGVLRLWDWREGRETFAFQVDTGNIGSLTFSTADQMLFSAANDGADHGAVQAWRFADDNAQEVWRPVNNSTAMAVSLSPNQNYLAAAVEDYASFADFIRGKRNCIRVWTTRNNRQWVMYKDNSGASHHTQFVLFSPDSKLLASDMGQATIKIWDLSSRDRPEPVLELIGHRESVMSAAFSRDGRWLVTGAMDKTVRLWFLGGETVESEILTNEDYPIMKVALSPDNRLLVTAQDGISLHVWDLAQRKRISTLDAHKGTINGLAFSPDGTCFASASADGTIKVWGLV